MYSTAAAVATRPAILNFVVDFEELEDCSALGVSLQRVCTLSTAALVLSAVGSAGSIFREICQKNATHDIIISYDNYIV